MIPQERSEGTSPVVDSELIDAGNVDAIEELPYEPLRHRERTAASLAKWLLILLAASWLFHYLTTLVLSCWGSATALDHLDRAFNIWFPVVSGLVGSAVTYYFTKEKG
jgi:hypothetical protein